MPVPVLPLGGILSPQFDPNDATSRAALTQAITNTILFDLHGMEEDAGWSKDRVLYIPTRTGAGRVCIETRVPRGVLWTAGLARGSKNIRLTYREQQARGDFIHRMRDVRLVGSIAGITTRVRNAAIEGLGILEAILRTP